MKEARFFYVPDAPQKAELPEDEAQHALRVLRLASGDEIFLMDGRGSFYHAVVTIASKKHCAYQIHDVISPEKTWKGRILLAIAPTKMMERMEWMTEKCTEIGFDELAFLDCNFSERKSLRVDRVKRIVVAAAKQSRKAWMPQVRSIVNYADFISEPRNGQKYIAHCYDEIPRVDFFDTIKSSNIDEDLSILIGPEGDFSIDEVRMAINQGYTSVSLGRSRLRTETAGMMAVAMAQLIKRK